MTLDPHLLGPALRALRLEAGYEDGKQFAAASGISRSQVSRWETGVYHPSAPNLFRWLNACRATLGDLERVMGRLG